VGEIQLSQVLHAASLLSQLVEVVVLQRKFIQLGEPRQRIGESGKEVPIKMQYTQFAVVFKREGKQRSNLIRTEIQ
jgi:hypothetical protein